MRPHDGEIAAGDANRRFLKQEINKIDGSHRGENRTPALGGAIATVVRGVQLFLTNPTPRHRMLHPLRTTMESGRIALSKPSRTGLIKRSGGAKGGIPPYDAVLMFKVLVCRRSTASRTTRLNSQIQDRLSFKRFLGLRRRDGETSGINRIYRLYREEGLTVNSAMYGVALSGPGRRTLPTVSRVSSGIRDEMRPHESENANEGRQPALPEGRN